MSIRPEEHNWHLVDLPRDLVYNEMTSVEIDLDTPQTMETRRQADMLWPRLDLEGRKMADKLDFFYHLFNAGKRDWHERGVIRYPRHPNKTSCAHLQVIDAAVEKGFRQMLTDPGVEHLGIYCPIYDQGGKRSIRTQAH